MPINHHKLHLACTALLGQHQQHMARTARDAPILEVPILLYLLAMYRNTKHAEGAQGVTAAVPHPVPRRSMAPWHESRPRLRHQPPNGGFPTGTGEWPSGITSTALMNADETVNSLVGQLEIYRKESPRWIPNAWVHQAHLDHAPSESFCRGELSGWVKASCM
jgi:hypothetical protein